MSKSINNLGNLCDSDYKSRDMRTTSMHRVGGNGQPNVPSQHYKIGKVGSQTPTSGSKSHTKA